MHGGGDYSDGEVQGLSDKGAGLRAMLLPARVWLRLHVTKPRPPDVMTGSRCHRARKASCGVAQ